MKKKRLLGIFIALCMIFAMLPVSASAEVGSTEAGMEEVKYFMYEGLLDYSTPEGSGFTLDGDTLTYDNPDYGTYSRMYFDIGDGVTFDGLIYGGSAHPMTTTLYDNYDNLSYWSRNHTCDSNCATSLMFNVEDGMSLNYELIPASAGTISRIPGSYVLQVNITAPATIKVTAGTSTTIVNGNGSSLTTTGDDLYYSALTLVVDDITDSEGSDASQIVISSLGGDAKAIAFDIHLELDGEEYPVQDGDSVTVTLPVPDGWNAGDILIYYVSDDGTMTDMQAVPSADGKTVSFTTTHFSTYVMAQENHEHSFGDWTDAGDGLNHTRKCSCGEVETQAHTWDNGKVTTAATADSKGVKTFTCTVCGAEKTETFSLSDTSIPQTGDSSILPLWIVLMLLSAAGYTVVCIRKRKTN